MDEMAQHDLKMKHIRMDMEAQSPSPSSSASVGAPNSTISCMDLSNVEDPLDFLDVCEEPFVKVNPMHAEAEAEDEAEDEDEGDPPKLTATSREDEDEDEDEEGDLPKLTAILDESFDDI